jgi:hypothetical protein
LNRDAPPTPTPQGPTDTAYEGGVFELAINVPEQYPLVPPAVRYRTKIFHPNVHFKVRCCPPASCRAPSRALQRPSAAPTAPPLFV